MRSICSISISALTAASVLAATPAQSASRHRHAPPRPDPRDARIEALESQVGALVQEMRALRAERVAAAPVAVAAAPTPDPVTAARVVGPVGVATAAPAPPASPPSAPTGGATILAGKPSIASPDGRFVANLHGVAQFDAAAYLQASARPQAVDFRRGATAADSGHARDLADGTGFRRARIGVDGKVFGDLEYGLLFEFGGSGAEDGAHLQEGYIQYSGFKPFHLRLGAFRPSLGLEDQTSVNSLLFNERPAVVDASASLSGADFREGFQLWASGDRWFASGIATSRNVATINSTGTTTAASFDQALGFVGRAVYLPFKGDDWLTLVGVHGSYAYQVVDSGGPDVAAGTVRYPIQFRERPELRVDGTRLVDTGAIDAQHGHTQGFEFAAQKQNLLVQAEHESFGIQRRNSTLSDPGFSGWYVEAAWTLTGERRRFNPNTFAFDSPPVDHPFDLDAGTWGAWELALRYSYLNLNYHPGDAGKATPADGVRGGEQQILTAGLNWYLNPVIRFMLDYQHVDVNRLSPSATTFATPVGAQIGQKYDSVSLRSQLSF